MRFDLEIRNIQGAKRIVLPFLCTYPRSFGRVEAIIDTGASQTILSAGDSLRLNIPFKNFTSTKPIRGFGKGNVPALLINNFQMVLHSKDKRRKNLNFPITVIDVPKLNKFGGNVLNNALTLPTLIGLDFLEINKLKLFIDINNHLAYLEEI